MFLNKLLRKKFLNILEILLDIGQLIFFWIMKKKIFLYLMPSFGEQIKVLKRF